jgi:hypothetical protein
MSSDTVIAVLEAASQGLKCRPGLVEAASLVRALGRMAEAEAATDPVAAALAQFAELIAERMVETITDIAELARVAAVSNGARL